MLNIELKNLQEEIFFNQTCCSYNLALISSLTLWETEFVIENENCILIEVICTYIY